MRHSSNTNSPTQILTRDSRHQGGGGENNRPYFFLFRLTTTALRVVYLSDGKRLRPLFVSSGLVQSLRPKINKSPNLHYSKPAHLSCHLFVLGKEAKIKAAMIHPGKKTSRSTTLSETFHHIFVTLHKKILNRNPSIYFKT